MRRALSLPSLQKRQSFAVHGTASCICKELHEDMGHVDPGQASQISTHQVFEVEGSRLQAMSRIRVVIWMGGCQSGCSGDGSWSSGQTVSHDSA